MRRSNNLELHHCFMMKPSSSSNSTTTDLSALYFNFCEVAGAGLAADTQRTGG